MNPLDVAKARVKRDREARALRQQERETQGWQRRAPLTRLQLRHDGSTRHERLTSTPPRTTPWVPA